MANELQSFCEYLKSSETVKKAEDCDRLCFAILKVSKGSEEEFEKAIELARTDWRDLLVAAEFADSTTTHNDWYNGQID